MSHFQMGVKINTSNAFNFGMKSIESNAYYDARDGLIWMGNKMVAFCEKSKKGDNVIVNMEKMVMNGESYQWITFKKNQPPIGPW